MYILCIPLTALHSSGGALRIYYTKVATLLELRGSRILLVLSLCDLLCASYICLTPYIFERWHAAHWRQQLLRAMAPCLLPLWDAAGGGGDITISSPVLRGALLYHRTAARAGRREGEEGKRRKEARATNSATAVGMGGEGGGMSGGIQRYGGRLDGICVARAGAWRRGSLMPHHSIRRLSAHAGASCLALGACSSVTSSSFCLYC